MRSRLALTLTAAGVAVATAAVALFAVRPDHVSAASNTLTKVSAAPYTLSDNGSFATYAPRVAGLAALLPNVKVSSVMSGANRATRKLCHSASTTTAGGFCWNSGSGGDDTTTQWYPQGITASWDAYDAGTYDGHRILLASWYDTNGVKGVRVSFVDMNAAPGTAKYRHVLLVEPTSNDNFRAVKIHAGGMAWYGDYLYVADTSHGMRVFDMRHIWSVASDPTGKVIGKGSDGKYHAANYAYVLPQVGTYTQPSGGSMVFSYVSLDRSTSPDSVVAGQYINGRTGARLVRWSIDATTRKLITGTDGSAHAVAAYTEPHQNLQGVVSYNDTYYTSRSRGDSTPGIRYRDRVGAAGTSSAFPIGPEDLTYDRSTKHLWTLTEHPGRRVVVAVKVSP